MLTVHNIINSKFAHSNIDYLELGLSCGTNFSRLNISNKESVDIAVGGVNGNPTYLMNTDQFFNQNKKKYDIIFIDADHEYTQVIKDFNNSIDALKENGIIFLHDLYPNTLEQTLKHYCYDSYKILDFFIKNNYDIIVNADDYGSTCVFNPKKININDVDGNLDWNVFINQNRIDGEIIVNDINYFIEKFNQKWKN